MDVYQIITDKIISSLEQNKIPWKKTWACEGPKNYISKQPYHGINYLLLSLMEYKHPYYLTFKQANDLGGHVKRGEKATLIAFWKMLEVEDEEREVPLLRYYYVFNIEQCEGIPLPEVKKNNPIKDCESIVKGYKTKPTIKYGGERAYYAPKTDYIQMPIMTNFVNSECYYATLFHEMVHSTGHKKRLNRETDKDGLNFLSEAYSKEELVAEIGSAFLCSMVSIANKSIDNQTAYIKGWLKELRSDKRFIFSASSKAKRATDYILKGDDKHE